VEAQKYFLYPGAEDPISYAIVRYIQHTCDKAEQKLPATKTAEKHKCKYVTTTCL